MFKAKQFLAALVFLLLCACAPAEATQAPPTVVLVPGQDTPTPGEASPTASPTAVASATPSNAPDLSGEQIVLIHLCDRTGPLGGANASRIQAVEDAVTAINAAGGIFGAELDLQFADTAGTPEDTERALARMIRENGERPLVLVCDPASELGVRETMNEDEIPGLSAGVFADEDGFLFGLDANPDQHFAFFMDDLLTHWAERKPQGAGSEIRIATLAWPEELSGALAGEELVADAEAEGIQFVLQAQLAAEVEANVFNFVYHAREENANVIYTNVRGFGLAALLNALHDLGLRDRFVVAAPALALDAEAYAYLADPSYAEGVYLTSVWAWWQEAPNPGIQAAGALGAADEVKDWGYLQMVGAVDLARRALEDAILANGFENLSPETVFAALQSLEDYQVLGGLFSVDYSGGNRSLIELRLWQVGAGQGELFLVPAN